MGRTILGDNDHNRRLRHDTKTGEPQAGDEREGWSRERLLKMDAKFRQRVEHALRLGREHIPDGTAGERQR
jgi:hypothetical protein